MNRKKLIKETRIPDNAMNKSLTYLYEKILVNYQMILKKYGVRYALANIYLLAVSDDYLNAKVKAMVLGKETQGWGGEFGNSQPTIAELQQLFSLYTNEDKGNGAAFHRLVNWLSSLEDVSVLANNIVKIGKANTNGHYITVAKKCNKEMPLLRQEIEITMPDLILCPTSNIDSYNLYLKEQLGEFTEEDLDEHIYLRYYESFPSIPVIICPHPQGKKTEDVNRVKEIVSEIVQRIAKKK